MKSHKSNTIKENKKQLQLLRTALVMSQIKIFTHKIYEKFTNRMSCQKSLYQSLYKY